MKNKDISTREYYIVYFDILGYKAYFEDKENDVLELLRINIAIAEDTGILIRNGDEISKRIIYRLFSDNCVILLETGTFREVDALAYLFTLVGNLQLKFLRDYRIPIRCGITKGDQRM